MDGQIWQWDVVVEAGPELARGAVVTVVLAAGAIGTGSVLGTILGVALAGRRRLPRTIGRLVVTPLSLLGLLPMLVLMIGVHHAVPASSSWLSRGLGQLRDAVAGHLGQTETAVLEVIADAPFASALLALTIGLTAAVATYVHRGAQRVSRQHVDVARALGLGPVARLRRVIVPETFRGCVLDLGRSWMLAIGATTLASVIGCRELVLTAWTLAEEHAAHLELFSVVALAYLVFLAPMALVLRGVSRSRWLRR
ncbi:MAG: ABC transporter permease subunit [Planctomycetota bacterium]|jgi:ABC-type amino acid transport system permease subunit